MKSYQIQGGAEMKAMNARFLISCLALTAMVLLVAPASQAQGPGVAFQASSIPLQVRGEGLTETIGAVVLQATAAGTIPAGSSITIVYSGSIAKATTAFPGTNTNGLSCVIQSTAGCTNGGGSFTTSGSGSQLTVAFGATTSFKAADYLEISEVRMNVNSLGTATTTVTATLSGTSANPTTNPITFTQSQVSVASIVNPSIKGSVTAATAGIQTCAVPVVGGTSNFSVTAAENYPAAFTSSTDETSFTGTVYTVTNGSEITMTISNVPSGLAVAPTTYSTTTTATPPNVMTVTEVGSAFQVSTGSALTYTFSVNSDSLSAIESFTVNFEIGIPNSGGTAFVGTTQALPAIGTVVNVTAAVSLAPSSGIVSFATNNEGGGTVVTIGDCVTNLLFPFTTNQVGFDTNIQISNTSTDKLAFPSGGATAQSGTCTLTYYPTDLTTQTASASGTAGTPSQFTTPTVPSGGAYSFAQSTSTFKGQSGYMFAVCRFLDAHGFSFVVNGTPSTGTISQGLLALVIPNSSLAGGRLANPSGATGGVTIGAAGSWEGLVH
jgi:hypothetical protein